MNNAHPNRYCISREQYIILKTNTVDDIEIKQAKKEGNSISNMMEAYGLSRYKITQMLKGKIKTADIPKTAPVYDGDE